MCPPHSLQHLLDLTFGLRELLCIASAQHHIGVGPVTDSSRSRPRIGLGNLTELHPDVAFARIRAHDFKNMRTPILSLGATSSSMACMIEGTPAITITLPIQKPGAPDHLVEDEFRALGNARHAQARLVHLGAGRLHPFVQDGERARIAVDGTPNAFATQSAVMSPWAVTTSLEADELAVGMITCEMFKGQDSWSSTPDQRRAPALRTAGRFIGLLWAGGWFEKKEGAHRPGADTPDLCNNLQFSRFQNFYFRMVSNRVPYFTDKNTENRAKSVLFGPI